jgi:hypothetical protein
MTNKNENIVVAGLRQVWRHQRILWWYWGISLLLSALGTLPFIAKASMLDYSLQSQRLVNGFDFPTFAEFAMRPDVQLPQVFSGSVAMVLLFLAFAVFISGGVLEAYRSERKLTTGEFFGAAGTYFWRMVRIMIVFAIVFGVIAQLAAVVNDWSDRLASDSPKPMLGFQVQIIGLVIAALLALFFRLAFDMAQVNTVAENERKAVRRSIRRGFALTFKNFVRLYGMFLVTTVVWLAILAVASWLWLRVPPRRSGLVLLLGEFVLLTWTATRLWQRASEMAFYTQYQASLPVAPPVTVPPVEAAPVETLTGEAAAPAPKITNPGASSADGASAAQGGTSETKSSE